MVKRLANLGLEDIVGIEGYRQIANVYYPPHFLADLPSNWILEEYPMTAAKGRWISLRGPVNQSRTRHTSLDIYLIEREDIPRCKSLDSWVAHMLEQESIGSTTVLSSQETLIGGHRGHEVKIRSQRILPSPSGVANLELVKQWMAIDMGGYFFVVMYESSLEDFDIYFPVYERFLATLEFPQNTV